MNKIIGIFALFAMLAFPAVAQKGAVFQFTEDQHDFGKVKEGEKVVHAYEFKNAGDQPLMIMKAEANCGCTTVDWTKTPVLPGKSGKVTVTFDSEGRAGKAYKEITIQSNAVLPDPAMGRYRLVMKGEVEKK